MRILSILGSPRRTGNTATLLSMFEDRVKAGHEVDRITVTQHDIAGCLGCYKCQEKIGEPGCVRQDDALPIFERMMQADAIVYASPLYCWSFTAQMKPLIDRHFCLVTGYGTPEHNSLIGGKRAALLVTCMGPIEGNCDPIRRIFDGFAGYAKLDAVGSFILPYCTTPDIVGGNGPGVAQSLAEAITG